MTIEEKVLKRISPTEKERETLHETVDKLMEKVSDALQSLGVKAKPVLAGSVAKDTFLRGPEIDIFIAFPRNTARKDLEKYGLKVGEMVVGGRKMYAEHPYIHGIFRGHEVDIVPCYKLDHPSERMTAVDRTPFHTEYVLSQLGEDQRNEVRLFKQFTKGIGVYGAEAKVEGLSGYLCELLILKYGSFKSLLRNIAKWKTGVLVELDVKAQEDFEDPLTVIDPVDPKRNVASALSTQQFSTLIHAAREYLKKPRMEFFFPKETRPWTSQELRREMELRGTSFFGLLLENPDVLEDVLYTQLKKCQKSIVGLLDRHDFRVHHSQYFVTGKESLFLFELESDSLPLVRKHIGPPVTNRNSRRFLLKWEASDRAMSMPYIEEDRWVVDVSREYCRAFDLIEGQLFSLNVGKDLSKSVRKGFSLLGIEDLTQDKYLSFLTKFLERKFPWER